MRTLLTILLMLSSGAYFFGARLLRASSVVPAPSDQAKLAQAALIVLREIAIGDSDAAVERVRLEPHGESTLQDAVQRLSVLRKPLECSAQMEMNTLKIQCSPLSRQSRWLLTAQRTLTDERHQREGRHATALDLQIVGQLGTVLLKSDEAAQFETDYLFLGDYLMSEEIGSDPTFAGRGEYAVRRYRPSRIS